MNDPYDGNVKLWYSIVLFISVFTSVNAVSQNKSIEIMEYTWTDSVDAAGLYHTKLNGNVERDNVILWLKVKMGKAWIDSIKNNNGLPLRFKWFHNPGAIWSSRFVSSPIDSMMYTKQKSKLDSLKNETPNNYKLEWVLWSQSKEKLQAGAWNVKVVKPPSKVIQEFTINIK